MNGPDVMIDDATNRARASRTRTGDDVTADRHRREPSEDAEPSPRLRRRRRSTIRFRTTVLATATFVVFGVAIALVARSVVVRIVTSQRTGAAESALDRLLSGPLTADTVAAIEADSYVRVTYYDAAGTPMTVESVMSVVGDMDRTTARSAMSRAGVDGSSPAEDAVGGGDSSGVVSSEVEGSDTSPEGTVVEFSTGFPTVSGAFDGDTGRRTFFVTQQADEVSARADLVLGDTPISVAVSASRNAAALAVFDRTMIVLIAALALVVAAMSWFSVSFALRPVEAIRRQVARTDPRDLSHHVPRPGTGDEIDRLATTMNDLLDRLHRASIEQKRFVSDASHELRSPVTAALATIQTVDPERMGPGWSEVEPVLTDATVRLSALIDDLFLMSVIDERRVCGDGLDSGPADGDGETDLDEIALRIAERPHRCPVAVRVDRPVRVRADARLIDRCVTNLVDNATRYASDSVLITVGLGDEGRPELTVIDDGCGIQPDEREIVFERFARLDQSRSSDGGGAGLGLPIARQIAEQQGARLTIAEPSDECGASFQLTFDERSGTG